MIDINAYCLLQGDEFSPSMAEELVKDTLAEKNEPRELGSLGKYKDRPLPYGSAHYLLTDLADFSSLTPLHRLAKNIKYFKQCGATSIVLHFDIAYEGQCNLEMEPEFLKQLSLLSLPITMTCYEK